MIRCKKAIFLVGPTASGKTGVSLLLAKRLNAEIVSLDSMLVYKGMDIGTAKPAPRNRKKVPHHLIDLFSPRRSFSAHEYCRRAIRSIQEIDRHGKIPLVVGGSGLYLSSLLQGFSDHPGGNAKVRRDLNRQADQKGLPFLYQILQRKDPDRARKVHPNDRRRVIRALEILTLTGKRPSEWYQTKNSSLARLGFSVQIFGLQPSRELLYRRINQRVLKMFRAGFVREVKKVQKRGMSKTARQALGYREILQGLKEGTEASEMIRSIQQRTRQFAKRQLTWFRRLKEIEWVGWEDQETTKMISDKIYARIYA